MKYSGIAFQMLFLLLGGWFLGSWLDQKLSLTEPYIALSLTFLLLIGYFYKLYREVMGGKL